ncbi:MULTISPECIES: zf-HC2 domain-containing protein [Streptomyces]|uniref:Zf-HC2 domain-containing protein n=1 Tax=Streptomyces caniscabiei TaxID=2746961 RepID=A0ABU4MLI9_9ACTN|nr:MULTISPECIES: zf-HC2 domain-containing protein [Streptomyces]MBE4733652.1 zf-HC2 domain-containing protein [Streptomyces caniscabiei]MBE4754829.1 zf-HC2 domain-containing protein [Streptomyces caniscabiei]MBE4782147.1 zf-HC2 domain-containing protein [Streptomyces caniscabiei]MBE4793435.1 zf-HC2 domain-containing protein [Streptomyces caniscabiei]MDX2940671.1 zf-HC2 domain-containing protein [Streptomyces caniscabiei]
MSWHADDGDLREYAHGTLAAPRLWSVETHLAACADCRAALSAHVPPAEISAGWARLDAALDAPRPGPVESLLVRLGVADHTARLLAATPVLRGSWLGAVVLTLLLAVGVGVAASPLLLLATAPLLPLAGVAVSFGPALDPTYETAVVAPMHTFRLLMVRTVAVLATTTALSALASLALPSFGLAALGWLLPALALTSTGVALTARLGPVLAPVLVGTGWTALVVLSRLLASGTPLPFTAQGQGAAAGVAVLASALLVAARDRFDSGRALGPSPRSPRRPRSL